MFLLAETFLLPLPMFKKHYYIKDQNKPILY